MAANRRFQISGSNNRFQLSVKPASYNWFSIQLDRDEATQLMISLLGLLLHRDKPKP